MSAAKSVSATFDLLARSLTANKAGTGGGSIECSTGSAFGACASSYSNGTTVTLKATPDSHSTFGGWSGAGCSGTGNCVVTLNADTTVSATFTAIMRTLSVVKAGSGTVTCNGGACASSYQDGSKVTLAAVPASGSAFSGWEGGGCSGTGACVVTLNADTTVIAMFSASEGSEEGSLKISSSAPVSGGEASLTISCKGPGACRGTLQLTAKVKVGKKVKTVVIGSATYDVAAGKTATVKVKITNAQVKKMLKEGRTVAVSFKGAPGVKGSVKLKTSKKHKKGRS